MYQHLGLVASALFSVGVFTAASATNLSLTFVQPENYTDAAYSRSYAGARERAEVQRDIGQHLKQLVERKLPPRYGLRIDVLDIDLAGRFEPFLFRTAADMRIMREVTWPRMKLRYTLTDGDRVLVNVEEQLADLNYLMSTKRYSDADRLRYEKAMLDDWFEKKIDKR